MGNGTLQHLTNLCCQDRLKEFSEELREAISRAKEDLAELERELETASVDDKPYIRAKINNQIVYLSDLEAIII